MTNASLQPLIALLLSALHEPDRRKQLINEFQQRIWNGPENPSESWEWEILRDLAHDLDFYEADTEARAGDVSYYGDERVEIQIKSALEKLEPYSSDISR